MVIKDFTNNIFSLVFVQDATVRSDLLPAEYEVFVADSEGKTNLDISSVGGDLLLVSQFTLYANCKKGNRPSFIKSGSPEHAEKLYDYIVNKCTALGKEMAADRPDGNAMKVETGSFGADMSCKLINDGPFTIDLDSDEL